MIPLRIGVFAQRGSVLPLQEGCYNASLPITGFDPDERVELGDNSTFDVIIPINRSYGILYAVSSVSPTANGSSIINANVTVTFANNSIQTSKFLNNGANSSIASGNGWSLSITASEIGDIFEPFVFTTTNSIKKIEIDLSPSNTMFDISIGSITTGTPNSASGLAFALYGDIDTNLVDYVPQITKVEATYKNMVFLDGTSYNDLYTKLIIEFYSGSSPSYVLTAYEGELQFVCDVDSLPSGGTLLPYCNQT